LWFVAIIGLIVGCGTGDPGVVASETTPALQVQCGAVDVPITEPLELPDKPLDTSAQTALHEGESVMNQAGDLFDVYDWFLAGQTEERLVLFGRYQGQVPPFVAPYAYATFYREEGAWGLPYASGTCYLTVSAPGYGGASWVTDSDSRPDPESSELSIAIAERSCANGEPPEGRQIVPVVFPDSDRVTITVLVEPLSSGATCPGNPWYPIVVGLGEPLGDRSLYDGGAVPSLERVWPPTQASLDTQGGEP
jgi:hypothetical protein